MIFSSYDRTDASPKRGDESDFEFLDRSARKEICNVREALEEWISHYPVDQQHEVVRRIQSRDLTNFRSATFELLLYVYLTRQGWVLEPHPVLENNKTTRPDFLAANSRGQRFYLEAVLASQVNDTDPAGEARKQAVFDSLNKVGHTNFTVALTSNGLPSTQPSGAKIRNELIDWLNTLDPAHVLASHRGENNDPLPERVFEHEDWELKVTPIPILPERRGQQKCLIQGISGEGQLIDDWTPIRNAIRRKGKRYGSLDLPLVVAVNIDSFILDRIDEMQALYGQEQYFLGVRDLQADPESAEPRFERSSNGAWHGPTGPRSKRVSGAWIFNDLTPYNICSRRHTLYVNPWANYSVPDDLLRLPHAIAEQGGQMKWGDGLGLCDALQLPKNWPEIWR